MDKWNIMQVDLLMSDKLVENCFGITLIGQAVAVANKHNSYIELERQCSNNKPSYQIKITTTQRYAY